MKKGIATALVLLFCLSSYSKERNGKTFVVIFHEQEISAHKSSPAHIELNFLEKFETKSYSGNSDAALLITVPFSEWTVCDIGQTLVIVGNDRLVRLDEVAFRIIDLQETHQNFQTLISGNPDDRNGRKKPTPVKVLL